MKTDKFEKTIRRKLESITPDFHEGDWTKMQHYMKAHTPPTFWQQYSSWLGYAAAATVTSVMAFMYVNQLSQNNHLLSDVKQLKNQIEVIKNKPEVIQKTDTVYIVQQQPVEQKNNDYIQEDHHAERFVAQPQQKNDFQELVTDTKPDPQTKSGLPSLGQVAQESAVNGLRTGPSEKRNIPSGAENLTQHAQGREFVVANGTLATQDNHAVIPRYRGSNGGNIGSGQGYTGGDPMPTHNANGLALTRTFDEGFDQMETQSSVQSNNHQTVSRSMHYALAHRIAPKQVKSVLLATSNAAVKSPESLKKNASTKKAETTIPKLNLKVPYRFGFAQQWEGKNQVKTVVAEVVVSKHFSFSTGLSWLKIKARDFYSEKSYRDKTQNNFREDFKPKAMPFEGIENINIKPSMMQIPLTVAYRNDLKNNFTLIVGAGTNFTVKQTQDVTFDCYRDTYVQASPKPYIVRAIRSEQTTKKMDLNLVNSVNFSAGIEKSWHPVVLQAEGYLFTYFSPLSPQTSRSGPGFKFKLLYQIGKKM